MIIDFKKIATQVEEEDLVFKVWDEHYAFEDNFFQLTLIDSLSEELKLQCEKKIEDSKQKSLSLFYKLDTTIVCCLHKEKAVDRLLINLIENYNLKKTE